jgi:hypothetical protein
LDEGRLITTKTTTTRQRREEKKRRRLHYQEEEEEEIRRYVSPWLCTITVLLCVVSSKKDRANATQHPHPMLTNLRHSVFRSSDRKQPHQRQAGRQATFTTPAHARASAALSWGEGGRERRERERERKEGPIPVA